METKSALKPKLLSLFLQISKISLLALGFISFAVGVFYLFVYCDRYEFTGLVSITALAAVLSNIGLCAFMLGIYVINFLPRRSILFRLFYLISLCCLFLAYLLVALYSIFYSSRAEFNTNENMLKIFRNFDEKDKLKYETKRINWLQLEFNCCGLNSSADWNEFSINNKENYINPSSIDILNKWVNENSYSSIYDVPDSCCINQISNCGKKYSKDRSEIINTKGCLNSYLDYFTRDLLILSIGYLIGSVTIFILILFCILILIMSFNDYILIQRV